jgi:peptidoglycan hydrolase-like protein with peptidoglycan-binding domain
LIERRKIMMNQMPSLLRRGSTGSEVERLQRDLARLGYTIGSAGVDGVFGNDTEAAVLKFQQDHNLVADGVVGPQTGRALEAAIA